MKIGVRTPSLKKSIKARTTGKLNRTIKASVNPLYGKKGMGLINNPKKAVYNKIYNKTTIDALKPLKTSSSSGSQNSSSTNPSMETTQSITVTKSKPRLVNRASLWIGLTIFNLFGVIALIDKRELDGVAFYLVLFVITLLCYLRIKKGGVILKEKTKVVPVTSTPSLEEKPETDKQFFSNEEILVYDLETTGVHSDLDEILQLAIINGNGDVLFNSYFRPEHRKRWPKATEVNHITWAMVKDKPLLADKVDELIEIFSRAKSIVGYNSIGFDNKFLIHFDSRFSKLFKDRAQYDVMLKYANYKRTWDSYHGDYKWYKLEQAAKQFKYKPNGELHDALEDCRATL